MNARIDDHRGQIVLGSSFIADFLQLLAERCWTLPGREQLFELGISNVPRNSVAAQQESLALSQINRFEIRLYRRVDANRTCQYISTRIVLGHRRSEKAGTHGLVNFVVVLSFAASQHSARNPIEAAVANMTHNRRFRTD